MIATGVNADGHREILGLDVASTEDDAGWLAFVRGVVSLSKLGGGAARMTLAIRAAGVPGEENPCPSRPAFGGVRRVG